MGVKIRHTQSFKFLVILLIRGLEIFPEDLASCRLGNLSNELDATGQMLVCRERSGNVALGERL